MKRRKKWTIFCHTYRPCLRRHRHRLLGLKWQHQRFCFRDFKTSIFNEKCSENRCVHRLSLTPFLSNSIPFSTLLLSGLPLSAGTLLPGDRVSRAVWVFYSTPAPIERACDASPLTVLFQHVQHSLRRALDTAIYIQPVLLPVRQH